MHYIPVLLILISLITSLIIYIVRKRVHALAFCAQALITFLAFFYFMTHYQDGTFQIEPLAMGGYGQRIAISFAFDAVNVLFVFLTLFAWWMVFIYTYQRKRENYTLIFYLMFLQSVFLGMLQTNDLFNMFVFIELTTIIVTILIALKKTGSSLRAALYYLLLNTSGVLAFLIGIIFIYNTFGTINIQFITENMHLYQDVTAVRFAYGLMLAGISVKAALFPVFTWLPKAHGSAQSSVSALLSGLIVKGGIYLFIRINMMYANLNLDYTMFFFAIGFITAFTGIFFALMQNDLKQMLAFSTVSQIGIIIIALSAATGDLFYGGIFHLVNHAVYKMLLFMGVGVIIKVYHAKKLEDLRGVFLSMPLVSVTMIIAMLAITGMPFTNGYMSKAVISYNLGHEWLYWLLFLVNVGTATLFIKMASMFFGKKRLHLVWQNRVPQVALVILAGTCFALGHFYPLLFVNFFATSFSGITPYSLKALLDYGLLLFLGYMIYKLILENESRMIRSMRGFTLTFQTANYLFIVYMVAITVFFSLLTVLR